MCVSDNKKSEKQADPASVISEVSGFIHTDGCTLRDENGREFVIKGMAFGNNVWGDQSSAPTGHHDEDSYKELSELGFNAVRFYLNYALFENDNEPYKYRRTGFDWLDGNIESAKKYNMRLVLNMHFPQGGYQSLGKGDALWTDPENMERLRALWNEIARRYADEPAIIGYGLLNEPIPAGGNTSEEDVEIWHMAAQKLADSVRIYDKNHIIFIEAVNGTKLPGSDKPAWDLPIKDRFAVINGENIVYEFHTYEPFRFTHQQFDWAGLDNSDVIYPDTGNVITTGASWRSLAGGESRVGGTSGWEYLESSRIDVTDKSVSALGISFQASYLGEKGACFADDLAITEYDENGKLIRTVKCMGSVENGEVNFWSEDGSGRGSVCMTEGHSGPCSLCISGAVKDANLSSIRIKHTPGHTYKVSGYFRTVGVSENALVRPRLDMYSTDKVLCMDKTLLEDTIGSYLEFSVKHDVPIFCGEFGAGRRCFENGRGGEIWVADMLDIFSANHIGFSYHDYKEENFGLYYPVNGTGEMRRNEALAGVFSEKLARSVR